MNWFERMTYILNPSKLKKTKEALNTVHKKTFIQCSTDIDGSQIYDPYEYLNNSSIEFSIFKGFYIKTTDDESSETKNKKEKKKSKTYATYTQQTKTENEHSKQRKGCIVGGLGSGSYSGMAYSAKNRDDFYDAMKARTYFDD